MSRLSPSSQALFDVLTGKSPDNVHGKYEPPKNAGPTLVLLEDPEEPVEDIIEMLDEANADGRRVNSWLRRRKRHLAFDPETGEIALEGRTCCWKTVYGLNRILHRLRLPSEHICPECGRRWGVEMRVREERRHE